MKPSLLYRISSALLLLCAVLHTYGMVRPPTKAPAWEMVASIMRTVHFDVMGTKRTFWDFYFGFGMLLTAFLLFSAVLAWQLAALDKVVLRKLRSRRLGIGCLPLRHGYSQLGLFLSRARDRCLRDRSLPRGRGDDCVPGGLILR